MALIPKTEAARRLNRTVARLNQLIKEGKITPRIDPYGKAALDERDVENLRAYMDQGVVRGPKPASRGGTGSVLDRATNARWTYRGDDDDLPPVEPDQPPPPPPAPQKSLSELTEDDFNLFDEFGRLDPLRCRAWQEFEKARKLQTERYAVEGKYVEAAKVQPAIERAMQTIRKGVMAIPSRLKATYTDMSLAQVEDLERLCREALEKAIIDYENANS